MLLKLVLIRSKLQFHYCVNSIVAKLHLLTLSFLTNYLNARFITSSNKLNNSPVKELKVLVYDYHTEETQVHGKLHNSMQLFIVHTCSKHNQHPGLIKIDGF